MKSPHWSKYREQAAGYWPLKLLLILFRLLPAGFLRLCAVPVSAGYYIFSRRARKESCRFLEKAVERRNLKINPFGHILSFSLTVIEKVGAWGGKISLDCVHFLDDDSGELIGGLEKGEGALLICSHLGNAELLRALSLSNRIGISRDIPVTSIIDFSVTAQFNRMLRELNPQSMMRVIGVNDIGPDTAILLEERIAAGELVVVAGDRTPANTRNAYLSIPFLGETAPFAYGPFFLAALLQAPAYFVFALRQKDLSFSSQYDMHIHKSPISFDCSRTEREGRIEELARLFTGRLEYYCKQHPLQWYNFYNFWADPEETT